MSLNFIINKKINVKQRIKTKEKPLLFRFVCQEIQKQNTVYDTE